MGERVRETERKYETAGDGPSLGPDGLTGLPGVSSVATPEPVRLDAVYYDTPDLALAAHRRTLRRRTGGDDAGWHLKLPTAEADTRTEVHAPLGSAADQPPPELLSEVAAVVRGRPLAPVVRLRTTRRPALLRDKAGRTLAEIAYDEVAASAPGGPDTAWTEVEVELRDGKARLLDAVEERLTASGLRRSASPSKLARALGDRLVPLPRPADPARTAGQVATAYLHAQLTALLTLDPAVRRAEEDAVHRMRVATRRARSALKSFRRELDRTATDPLGGELRWLAGVLGLERDREVLAERLARRLAELDPALVNPKVRRRVTPPAGHSGVHAVVVRELDGPRYFGLLYTLESLLTAPPFRPAADVGAGRAAAATVRRDHARLRRRIEAALRLPPGDDRDTALHEARKDAKRARYSSEAAESVLGASATDHTTRMKSVQQLLGEHQDSVMCRRVLADLRHQARAAGENPAPYKAMSRRERELATAVEARLPEVWRAADRTV
ncbi:CYTH and CHAD domain-containing protein [Streptomyces sp.]|uniref:CYTH and CHAD domain-containing protein n=1 Tax=Streptomyces sp. TaxID=1931 RepID=UPI002F3E744A